MRRSRRPEQGVESRHCGPGAAALDRAGSAAPSRVSDGVKGRRADVVKCWPWAVLVAGALLCTIALMVL